MRNLKDLLALSMIAYKQGKFEESSCLFKEAMDQQGLDTFISEITNNAPINKSVDSSVPENENSIAPSLSFNLPKIVDRVSKYSSKYSNHSNSFLDEGEFEDADRFQASSSEECCGNPPCARTENNSCPIYVKDKNEEVFEAQDTETVTDNESSLPVEVQNESNISVSSVGPVKLRY